MGSLPALFASRQPSREIALSLTQHHTNCHKGGQAWSNHVARCDLFTMQICAFGMQARISLS